MVNPLQNEISEQLKKVTEDCGFEAQVILETVFGRDYRLRALSGALGEPTAEQLCKINEMVSRRILGEPLQYIVGEWEFFGLTFKVGKGALIPRQDTETLVTAALELLEGIPNPKVLDLCSGTGCVAIAIKNQRPDAEVFALELYDGAYRILCENAELHGGIITIRADALDTRSAEAFSELDLITANPPYLTAEDMQSLQREVKYEPRTALFGGDDGLKFYREISAVWKNSLRGGGHLAYEIGLGQEMGVRDILSKLGYLDIKFKNDLTNRVRAVTAQK